MRCSRFATNTLVQKKDSAASGLAPLAGSSFELAIFGISIFHTFSIPAPLLRSIVHGSVTPSNESHSFYSLIGE